jgi:hypothetical protein
MLAAHDAPLVLEVQPPFRPRADDLARRAGRLLGAGRLYPRV